MSHNVKNYRSQGGAEWVVGPSGSLDIESGGALKIAGTDVTSEVGQLEGLDRTIKVKKVALTAATGAGAMLSVANPESARIMITRLMVDVTTGSASGVGNFGTASGAAVASDNLIDGVSIAAAALVDSTDETDSGTNGKAGRAWAAAEYVTGTVAAGAYTGLVGNAYIHYVVP